MTQQQKAAIYILSVLGLWLVVYFVLQIFWPLSKALPVSFSVCGLWGYIPNFYRKKQRKIGDNSVQLDERDMSIGARASRRGYIFMWLYIVFLSTTMAMNSDNVMIPALYLIYLTCGGLAIMMAAYAINILWMYRKGEVSYEEFLSQFCR